MSEREEFYTSEQIDEQIDALLQRRQMPVGDLRMSHDLHVILAQKDTRADERSLQRVFQRLREDEHIIQQADSKGIPFPRALQFEDQGRSNSMHRIAFAKSPKVRSVTRVFAVLAALLVVVILIGSMLVITNLAHQPKPSSIVAPRVTQVAQLPAGIYSSNGQSVFRIDAQTHRVLWQQTLPGVTKIIPAGNAVYIVQAREQAGKINAVLKVDANSGTILWKHIFTEPAQGKTVVITQISDMVLAQGQLFVGRQTWIGSTKITGQIYVLSTADGSQQAVYTNASVWSLAVGNGVIAVSGNYSLQVYDANNGKVLWHIAFSSYTSDSVLSLKIVNGLVYATITNSDQVAGAGQSYIAAYRARTGVQVWQSPNFPGDALSNFTVDQNTIYFGTLEHLDQQPIGGHIYAYDMQSNTRLWSRPVEGAAENPLILSNGVLYTTTDSTSPQHARLLALNSTTGTITWQQPLYGRILDSFTVSKGVVYAGTLNLVMVKAGATPPPSAPEKMEAFDAASGQALWTNTQDGGTALVPTT